MIQPSAIALLDEAIRIHQKHMDDPKSDTPESEAKEMSLLKQARKALEGSQHMKPMMAPPQGMGSIAGGGM